MDKPHALFVRQKISPRHISFKTWQFGTNYMARSSTKIVQHDYFFYDRLVTFRHFASTGQVNYKCFLIVILTEVYVNFWIGNSNSIATFCHLYAILMLYDVSNIMIQKSRTGKPHFLIQRPFMIQLGDFKVIGSPNLNFGTLCLSFSSITWLQVFLTKKINYHPE